MLPRKKNAYCLRLRFNKNEITTTIPLETVLKNPQEFKGKVIVTEGHGFVFDFKSDLGMINTQLVETDSTGRIAASELAYFSKEKEDKFKEICKMKDGNDNNRKCGNIKILSKVWQDGRLIGFNIFDFENS